MARQLCCRGMCKNLLRSDGRSGITARRSFHRIWIAGKNSLVTRAPSQDTSRSAGCVCLETQVTHHNMDTYIWVNVQWRHQAINSFNNWSLGLCRCDNRVRCHYNAVNFFINIHKRLAGPYRPRLGMSFVDPAYDWHSASVTVTIHVISYNIRQCYNGTRLFKFLIPEHVSY